MRPKPVDRPPPNLVYNTTQLSAPAVIPMAQSRTHLETEDGNSLLVSLVQGGQLLLQLGSRDGSSGRVKDVKNELLSVEQSVGDELSSSEGDRAGGILDWQGSAVCSMNDRLRAVAPADQVQARMAVGSGLLIRSPY